MISLRSLKDLPQHLSGVEVCTFIQEFQNPDTFLFQPLTGVRRIIDLQHNLLSAKVQWLERWSHIFLYNALVERGIHGRCNDCEASRSRGLKTAPDHHPIVFHSWHEVLVVMCSARFSANMVVRNSQLQFSLVCTEVLWFIQFCIAKPCCNVLFEDKGFSPCYPPKKTILFQNISL